MKFDETENTFSNFMDDTKIDMRFKNPCLKRRNI